MNVLCEITCLIECLRVSCFLSRSKTQSRRFDFTLHYYLCSLAGKEHGSALKSHPRFLCVFLCAPQPKTTSTIQALIAKSASQRH